MNINKKIFKNFDYSIFFSMIAITIMGIVTISSATHAFTDGGDAKMFLTQTAYFLVAFIIGGVILFVDYNSIGGYYKVLYIAVNAMLVLVLLVGSKRNGAKAWLGVGSFGIQPSEFAKLITIITFAKLLEDMENINTIKNLGKLALYAAIPMGLIQLQPDTGTNLIFAVTLLGMVFVAGLDKKIIFGGLGIAITGIISVWELDILKAYQKNRILVFLKPEMDKLGSGYNAWVAKTAIGSGGFFGMGLYNGIQTNGNFIPESHTDFIFSVFGEEWGFLGAAALLLLYFNIIAKSIKIARGAKDKFGLYVITGILTMFTFQVLQNIGMDIGLMPITGIPLPFMSYGGSSLLTSVISIALVLNIGMRKQKINF